MKVLPDYEVSFRLMHPLQEALDGVPVESVLFQYWRCGMSENCQFMCVAMDLRYR